ncbi:phage regulatory CII family protein [Cupriavidus oxalaticus]|uniref:Uncharacterized protein n=1 Tax=Cupriavidus oxalaticus TaxID=96344 RepID=A0A4P7LU43_9BURK|nr:phage regulatory CII family protein [Cupriavidus oxalaticus]QBY56137.1 hypothetical protein E0W60_34325 [Cupriavidus oxalaticus]
MTYQYSDIDQHEALYNVARRYPGGGIEALAHAMTVRLGKQVSPNVLRNKLRPGITSHALNAEEFSLVVELCEEAGVDGAKIPVHALCMRHGMVAVEPLPAGAIATVTDLMIHLGNVSREFADAVKVVTDGADDGKIKPHEAERIQKEVMDLVRAAMALSQATARAAEQAEGGDE